MRTQTSLPQGYDPYTMISFGGTRQVMAKSLAIEDWEDHADEVEGATADRELVTRAIDGGNEVVYALRAHQEQDDGYRLWDWTRDRDGVVEHYVMLKDTRGRLHCWIGDEVGPRNTFVLGR